MCHPDCTCLFKKLGLDKFWEVTRLIVNFLGATHCILFHLVGDWIITLRADVFHISKVRPDQNKKGALELDLGNSFEDSQAPLHFHTVFKQTR